MLDIPVDYQNNGLLNQLLVEIDLQELFLVQVHVELDDEYYLQYDCLKIRLYKKFFLYFVRKMCLFSLAAAEFCKTVCCCRRCCAAIAAARAAAPPSEFCRIVGCARVCDCTFLGGADDGSFNRCPSPALENLTSLFSFEKNFLIFDISRRGK